MVDKAPETTAHAILKFDLPVFDVAKAREVLAEHAGQHARAELGSEDPGAYFDQNIDGWIKDSQAVSLCDALLDRPITREVWLRAYGAAAA